MLSDVIPTEGERSMTLEVLAVALISLLLVIGIWADSMGD